MQTNAQEAPAHQYTFITSPLGVGTLIDILAIDEFF